MIYQKQRKLSKINPTQSETDSQNNTMSRKEKLGCKMKISGWGRYPVINSVPLTQNQFMENSASPTPSDPIIATGNHRSYGDCGLAHKHLPMRSKNRLISFDETTGLLTCEAGVLLSEIIEVFLPRGWFPAVTPGTKFITVGGALGSDVHGKNHHVKGCFSECVESFTLQVPNHEPRRCSKKTNKDWFHSTCGGMGLTGVITQVSFYLKRVKSRFIKQTTIKTANLKETFQAFEHFSTSPYSVAWIDCLAAGTNSGRSLLMTGDFSDDGDLHFQPRKKTTVPFDFPSVALNRWSVKAFNSLYYRRFKRGESNQFVDFDSFFYPLDVFNHWNRIYGKNGFLQFQFILPKQVSLDGLHELLASISQTGMGSFLAVLKLYGPENQNWLSFPLEGYSLALDFKMQPGLIDFLNALTDRVVAIGGRVYLAKDAIQSRDQFEQSYPKVEKFRSFREKNRLGNDFQSLLSRRLGL